MAQYETPLPGKLLLARSAELPVLRPRGEHHRERGEGLPVGFDPEGVAFAADDRHGRAIDLSPEPGRLLLHALGEVEAAQGIGKTRVVLDRADDERLPAGGHLLQDEHVEARPGPVLGRGEARCPPAHDYQVTLSSHTASPPRGSIAESCPHVKKKPSDNNREGVEPAMDARATGLVGALREGMDREARMFGDLVADLDRLGASFKARDWTVSLVVAQGLDGMARRIERAESERSAVVADLAAALGVAAGTPLSTLVARLDPTERQPLEESGRRLRTEVFRLKTATGRLRYSAETLSGTLGRVLEGVFPERRGRIYGPKEQAVRTDGRRARRPLPLGPRRRRVQSTFAPIELGKRGLIAHSTALQTVGHNMSNATVEGYSRQRVEMKAFEPIYAPQLNRAETPGQIGQGMVVSSITRVRDMLLEARIVGEQNVQGYWEARDKYLLMLEQVQNEPTDQSVRTLLDRFWQSWQELSARPTETGARRAVLERGNSLAEGINSRYLRLKGIRDMIDGDVQGTVQQVNSLTGEIASLASEIIKSEALGDNPNDLYDRRDLLVGKLSTLLDITVSYRDEDELVISTGGMRIVQGRNHEEFALEPDPNDEGYGKLVWADGRDPVTLRGGTLASLVELRDVDTKGEIQALDLMSQNFVDLVNEVHRQGFGLDGSTGADFFVQHPFIDNAQGNYDANGDGAYDATYVYRATGANTLVATDQVGLRGTLTLPGAGGDVAVEYFPTDTVRDLVERINLSGAEVAARLNSEGRLSISGVPSADSRNPDFVLRGLQDSGRFLVGYAGILDQSGPAGAYAWTRADAVASLRDDGDFSVAPLAHPAGWIAVNQKIADDPNTVAAAAALDGRSAGPGDGGTALAIAQLRTEPVVLGVTTSFDNYLADRVADIGLRGEEAARSLETVNLVMKDLTDTRESLSGVNMDEELANMLSYQRGYESIARIVTTFDDDARHDHQPDGGLGATTMKRISSQLPSYDSSYYLRLHEWQLDQMNNKVAAQSRIKDLRDDPLAAARSVRLQSAIFRSDQYAANVGTLRESLTNSEGELRSAMDVLQRIRELGVQGANGIYDASQLAVHRRGGRPAARRADHHRQRARRERQLPVLGHRGADRAVPPHARSGARRRAPTS